MSPACRERPISKGRCDAFLSDELFATSRGAELREPIEGLYRAFSTARLADGEYLRNTPLRQLTLHDTASILVDAIWTLGSARDFNYFLPRILETWAYRGHYMDFELRIEMHDPTAISNE